jgi:16S rRNA (cytosine1402-N4)-methyltransferase
MGIRHIPVLVEEVMTLLRLVPHGNYVDGTLGGGGHASEILKQSAPDGIIVGIEWDEEAIAEARKNLASYGDRVKIFRENFVNLPDVLRAMQMEAVDGIFLDLGFSSLQIEKAERGFSLKEEGPLDMRMDQRIERTASDLVNHLSPQELEKILFDYGEERWAKRIARAIVQERERSPIETTQMLRKIVLRAIPKRFHHRRIDPATKTFQALRITVNEELENLKRILETGWKSVKKGGRICIISFHSLEDRLVKEAFRAQERKRLIRIVTKRPVVPSEEERERNPRSRSAKFRCAERV